MKGLTNLPYLKANTRKGADAQTLSADLLLNCGNIKHDSLAFIFICSGKWKYTTFKTPYKWIFGYNLVTFAEIFYSIIAEI